MMRKSVCLALLGALLLAPAADARKPRPKPVVDNVFAGTTDQHVPAYVKVLPHNGGVEAVFAYIAQCSDGTTAILWSGATKLPVRNGHFAFRRDEDQNGPQVTIDGRVGKKSASGTWQASFSFKDETGTVTTTCDSGLVNWTLPKTGIGGQLAGSYPLFFAIKNKKVATIQFVAELKCQSGASYFTATPYDDFPIAANGKFGDSFTDKGQPAPDKLSTLTIDIHGQVGKSKTKGTVHFTAIVTDMAGNQVDSCDSGTLNWSAAP